MLASQPRWAECASEINSQAHYRIIYQDIIREHGLKLDK